MKGETIPENERFYRLEVVQTFSKSGVALVKIDYFRSLLERNGARLASRSTLSRMIPVVLDPEKVLRVQSRSDMFPFVMIDAHA